MLLSQVQSSFLSSPSSFSSSPFNYSLHLKPYSTRAISGLLLPSKKRSKLTSTNALNINASLIQEPLLWAGRICLFYALSQIGLAGLQSDPLVSDLESDDATVDAESGDLGFSKWKQDEAAVNKSKLVSKWKPTTKGTLKRNYRVPSNPEGKRVLRAVASLLSEDDHFTDAASHKGCQIRRESAHGESVCCNNVRALFDELPTPHLVVEITPFPAGPLTENDYKKAEKLERVLKSVPNV